MMLAPAVFLPLLLIGLTAGLPRVDHVRRTGLTKGVAMAAKGAREEESLADAEPCCIPTSHGNVSLLFGSLQGGSPSAFSSMASVAFDQENYKAAAHQIIPDNSNPSSVVSIYVDYSGGSLYVAQPSTKQCSAEQLPIGMMGTCIPDDDYTYLGLGNLGFGSQTAPVNMWGIDGSMGGVELQFQAWTTPKDCGLVQMNMFGNTGDAQIVTSLGFFNMTSGIKDKSVFDIPSYCTSAKAPTKDNFDSLGSKPLKMQMSPLMQTLKYKFVAMSKSKRDKL